MDAMLRKIAKYDKKGNKKPQNDEYIEHNVGINALPTDQTGAPSASNILEKTCG